MIRSKSSEILCCTDYYLTSGHFRRFGLFPPPLYTSHVPAVLGRPLKQNEIFDVLDSKFVNVFPENEFNKILDEVEVHHNHVKNIPSNCKHVSR